MMDRQERWQRIEALLDGVLDLPDDETGPFLDEACAGEPALRAEVEALLAADRKPPDFLDGDAADLLLDAADTMRTTLEGKSLGPWRVMHEIGRGGMSTVYLGQRADGHYEQRVAIKVLRRDIASRDLRRRFHQERQILAVLDHPSIVRIQDGGITPDGRPYLVMEYIEGERIDRYCDRHRMGVADRMRLFTRVLDAVHYAHRNLIVHRDIKPANILVTPDGRVHLLDFGIAKLIDSRAVDGTAFTSTHARAMTPEYASPEQIRGAQVTTGSDVYALGVLLYELLSGRRPYVLEESTPWAIEKAICESEPERPSHAVRRTGTGDSGDALTTPQSISEARGTAPALLRTTLDGDLDAIVMKALRKEPVDRFGSAEAFREDIDRYLDGHAVLARQGNRSYAFRKFVRRNRWPVGITVLFAGLLLGSTILISIEQARTDRQRQRAELAATDARRESRTAAQVTTFLIELFGGSDPNVALGDSISAGVLLERGRERIDRELAEQPAVRASLLLAIGSVYSSLGRYEVADTLLERAAELRTRLFGETNADVAEAREAVALNFASARDFGEARGAYADALEIRRAIDGDQRLKIANNLAGLAYSQRDSGQPDSAFALMQESLAVVRSTGDTLSADFLHKLGGLATMLRALNRFDEAERIYQEVVPRQRELLGDRHPALATNLNNLGFLLRQKDFDGASTAYREALDIQRAVFGEDHPQTQTVMQNLASALIEGGHEDEAIEVLTARVAAAKNRWPEGHWRVGSATLNLGRALMHFERAADAEPYLRSAEASYAATIGRDHVWTLAVRAWIAACVADLARPREAGAIFDRNLTQFRTANLDGDIRVSLERLSDHLETAGLSGRAQAYRQILAR